MNKLLRPLILLTLAGLLFASCKKSSGGGDTGPVSEYFMTATVNGKGWSANVVSPTLNGACIGVTTTAGNASVVLMAGVQAQGKDSTAIALVFPTNITLNTATSFAAQLYTAGAYAESATVGYNTDPANKG